MQTTGLGIIFPQSRKTPRIYRIHIHVLLCVRYASIGLWFGISKIFFPFYFCVKKKKKNCRREKMAVRPFIFLIAQSRWGEIGRNVSTQKYIARVSYVVITKFVGIPLIMVKQFLYYLPYAKYTHTHTQHPAYGCNRRGCIIIQMSLFLLFFVFFFFIFSGGEKKRRRWWSSLQTGQGRVSVRIRRLGRCHISSV